MRGNEQRGFWPEAEKRLKHAVAESVEDSFVCLFGRLFVLCVSGSLTFSFV
jgi:hypothetical protein